MGFIGLATNFSLMSILFVGGNMLAQKEMTAGDLTRFAIQSAFVGLGFSGLSTFYRDMTESLDGAGRVYAAIDTNAMEQEDVDALTSDVPLVAPEAPEVPLLSNVVELRDVCFCYSSRPDQLVLDGLNMDIRANSFTCIVGPSGVGKSTLFGLLCGLHTMPRAGEAAPNAGGCGGSISVNEMNIAEVSKDWLHRHVSRSQRASAAWLLLCCVGSAYYAALYCTCLVHFHDHLRLIVCVSVCLLAD